MAMARRLRRSINFLIGTQAFTLAKRQTRDFLASYLRREWRRVFLLTALLLGGTTLQLANPQVLRVFIDEVTTGQDLDRLLRLGALFLAVAVVGQAVAVAETYVAENLGQIATNELRADLARHCFDLDLDFHNARTPGELIERVDGDVANLGNFFSRFVVQIGGSSLVMVGALILLFGVTPLLGASVTVVTLFALALLLRLPAVGSGFWSVERQASAELFGFLEERLTGTEDICSSGAVDHTMRRLADQSQALFRAILRRTLVSGATGYSANLLLTLITVVGLGLAADAYLQGQIDVGAVYLVFSYTQLLARPLWRLTWQLQDMQRASASLVRIQELLATSSRLDQSGRMPLPAGPLVVALVNVTFGYRPGEPVLRDLSLAIRPGEIVGLLGRTGSGKTTLARLVARFHDPDQGVIRIGGVDLRLANAEEMRRAVGFVTQEVHVFHASVRDNLTLFDRSIPDERIAAVLRAFGLWDWCRELPEGLDSRLAPGGSGLSAGQAQLLAFARVFLRDPGLVILDEPSSRLDPATETRVERALDHLLVGRTAIVIAHRLATVERAETIVILENGAVVEQGRREDLERDLGSRYSGLRRVGLEEVLA